MEDFELPKAAIFDLAPLNSVDRLALAKKPHKISTFSLSLRLIGIHRVTDLHPRPRCSPTLGPFLLNEIFNSGQY